MTSFSYLALALLGSALAGAFAAEPAESAPLATVPLWAGPAPGEPETPAKPQVMDPGKDHIIRAHDVSQPVIAVYAPPAAQRNGTAVVICPGGGYSILAMDLEGTEVARWLNGCGVTAVLLTYRVPARAGHPSYQAAVQDLQRALSTVRSRAAEWGIAPGRVGALGFSAGGHAVAIAAAGALPRQYPAADAVDQLSCRPDFALLIYPAYMVAKGTMTLNPEVTPAADAPPSFIVYAENDPARLRERHGLAARAAQPQGPGRAARLPGWRPRLRAAALGERRQHLAGARAGVVPGARAADRGALRGRARARAPATPVRAGFAPGATSVGPMRRARIHSCGLALGAWCLLACAAAQDPAPLAPADASTFFARALAVDHLLEPEVDDAAATAAFTALVAACRSALAGASTPAERIAVLNRLILVEPGVVYRSTQLWRDASLTAALLRHRCNCIAGATLYAAVGAALALPIRMVVIPRHAFVRWDGQGARINIETTAQGAAFDDATYLYAWGRCDPLEVAALGWGASLDEDRALAVLLQQAAGLREEQAQRGAAAELLDRALALAPNRVDLALDRFTCLAGIAGRRSEARAGIAALVAAGPPPTVLATALLFQAREQALGQRYDVERALLLRAFASAPKAIESAVLGQLMSCHRSLRDHGAARQCAELMVAMTPASSPELAGALYTLAMAQREDGLMDAAMDSIRAGLVANPEGWYLQVLRAGYSYSSGRREEGLADFAAVRAPRAEILMYDCMCTWFACVRGSRVDFMAGVARVLAEDRSGYVLEWLDQDPDVHAFTAGDAEYAQRIARHRAAILEEPAPVP